MIKVITPYQLMGFSSFLVGSVTKFPSWVCVCVCVCVCVGGGGGGGQSYFNIVSWNLVWGSDDTY